MTTENTQTYDGETPTNGKIRGAYETPTIRPRECHCPADAPCRVSGKCRCNLTRLLQNQITHESGEDKNAK